MSAYIEEVVQEWLFKYDAWQHKSEASKALVSSINHFIYENSLDAVNQAAEYIEREIIEAEKLRQAVSDAAAYIK